MREVRGIRQIRTSENVRDDYLFGKARDSTLWDSTLCARLSRVDRDIVGPDHITRTFPRPRNHRLVACGWLCKWKRLSLFWESSCDPCAAETAEGWRSSLRLAVSPSLGFCVVLRHSSTREPSRYNVLRGCGVARAPTLTPVTRSRQRHARLCRRTLSLFRKSISKRVRRDHASSPQGYPSIDTPTSRPLRSICRGEFRFPR
mmetsp:Transcript_10971/g.40589  ORF Transcript_10971/g.40589 Transcript_10971/m.40589 type:complete len:202 (+) Transcript_10971:3609-4214(+)